MLFCSLRAREYTETTESRTWDSGVHRAGPMRRRGEGSAGRGREGEGAEGSGTAPLQLTEEEKAVLVQCRRNSTARGRWAGLATCS